MGYCSELTVLSWVGAAGFVGSQHAVIDPS